MAIAATAWSPRERGRLGNGGSVPVSPPRSALGLGRHWLDRAGSEIRKGRRHGRTGAAVTAERARAGGATGLAGPGDGPEGQAGGRGSGNHHHNIITTTLPQFGQFLGGTCFAEGKATKLSSVWSGRHEEVLKVPLLRTVVVILGVDPTGLFRVRGPRGPAGPPVGDGSPATAPGWTCRRPRRPPGLRIPVCSLCWSILFPPLCGQTEKGRGDISPRPSWFCCVVWGFSCLVGDAAVNLVARECS